MLKITTRTVTVSESPAVQCFRLVHNGKEVLGVSEGSNRLSTANQLVCAESRKELDEVIEKLGLSRETADAALDRLMIQKPNPAIAKLI